MSSARQQPSLTDWVVIALSPALVMLMVGSLTFFLAEVLYQGRFYERLLYTLAWFVFATVLIARVSIEEGYGRATLLGAGLAFVTFIALCAWIGYANTPVSPFAPLINLFLMAVVWWSAHKLTWDCTHIDEDRKASGRGVLAAAGLDENAAADNPVQQKEDEEAADGETKEKKKRKKDAPGVLGWWARFDRFRERQKQKPHTPGVWVVYFSLAALPLFGLGQALIPAEDAARRSAAFTEMAVYVGSGLGLLVTTSLLGLRKYLRDRGARIPAAMTVGWVGLGAGLIVLFLAVGAVLPRPHSETPLFDLRGGDKSKRQASKNAVIRDKSAGEGQGADGQKNEAGKDGKQNAKGGEKGGKAGEKGQGGGQGKDKGGQQKGGEQGKQQGEQGKQQNPQNKNDPQKGNDPQQKDGEKQNAEQEQNGEAEKDRDADGQANEQDRSEQQSSSKSDVGSALEKVGSVIKWVIWIALAVLVIVGVFVFFLKYMSNFTDWAKNLLDWLRGLFGRKPKAEREAEEEAEAEAAVPRPPPFAAFPNPFEDGSAKRMRPERLIAYSFEAFDSWAWDRDRGRRPDETPNEFAGRIGAEFPDLDAAGRALASLFVWAQFSRQELPTNAVQLVRDFWQRIETAEAVEVEG